MTKHALLVLAVILSLSFSLPGLASAASTARLSNTAQTNVEKLGAAAGGSVQTRLTEQVKEIQLLETEDLKISEEISSLRSRNDELLLTVRASIKQLDAAKLGELKQKVTEAKARYKPLFELQTSLNSQLSYARKLKNKTAIAALESQVAVAKAAAQLAKEDIRSKEQAYMNARYARDKTVKQVRAVLADVSLLQARIRTEKKASVETGKSISAERKKLQAVLKNKDAAGTLISLTSLSTLSRQMISQKKNMVELEKKIRALADKAKGMLPAS